MTYEWRLLYDEAPLRHERPLPMGERYEVSQDANYLQQLQQPLGSSLQPLRARYYITWDPV